jgi:hypothetical protein
VKKHARLHDGAGQFRQVRRALRLDLPDECLEALGVTLGLKL